MISQAVGILASTTCQPPQLTSRNQSSKIASEAAAADVLCVNDCRRGARRFPDIGANERDRKGKPAPFSVNRLTQSEWRHP